MGEHHKSVAEAEGQELSAAGGEGRLCSVVGVHRDLSISRLEIKSGEPLSTKEGVEGVIFLRERGGATSLTVASFCS